MTATLRIALAATLIAATTSTATAQFGGSGLRGSSVALSADVPMGKLDTTATTGFGFAWRRALGSEESTWTGRTIIGFDRFGGRGNLESAQFISFGIDIVHHSTSFYQFGGFAQSLVRYDYKQDATAGFSPGPGSDMSFGFTGGIGVNLGSGDFKTYIEMAATTSFTRGGNSSWFPARFGVRF